MSSNLTIDQLGAKGDGIAQTPSGPIYVPFTLPGEEIRADVENGRASEIEITKPSAARVVPPCPHFTICGGCQLQHFAPTPYAAWKRQNIVDALVTRGFVSPPVDDVIAIPPGTRRRITLTAIRAGKETRLGLSEIGSNKVVDIGPCPVLVPAIEAALPALKRLVSAYTSPTKVMKLHVTAGDAGLDLDISGGPRLTSQIETALAKAATQMDLARITWNRELAIQTRQPVIAMGRALVAPPPAGFLQASVAGQEALTKLVLEGMGKPTAALDLFSGSGTFTFPLAETGTVLAVESERAALEALNQGANHVQGLKHIKTMRRDLFDDPLGNMELRKIDAVVFDPPRAGAAAQAKELAKSAVPRVVGVSCSPATFARDARTLVDGGYALTRVTPVDQFVWSHHIELVGVFERSE